MSSHELGPITQRITALEAGVARRQSRLSLRSDYLLGRIDTSIVRWRDRRDAVQIDLGVQRAAMSIAQQQLERARALEAAGKTSGESERVAAKLDRAQATIEILELELKLLKAML